MNEKNWKNKIEGVSEMAKRWGISPHYLKKLCYQGKVDCKKIGNTWVIYSCQPRPNINHRDFLHVDGDRETEEKNLHVEPKGQYKHKL